MFHTCDAKAATPDCEQPVIEFQRHPRWDFAAATGNPDGYRFTEIPACGENVTRTFVEAWKIVDGRKVFGPRSPVSDRIKYVPEPSQNLMLAAGVGGLILMGRRGL